MKHISFAALCGAVIVLAGCSSAPRAANPLLQAQRHEELADALANIIIQGEPASKDEVTKKRIEAEIANAKSALSEAQEAQRGGMAGTFISNLETVEGWVLYKDGSVHLSSDFRSRPGLDLRLYLTTAVDPRDVAFPDVTAKDLGRLDFPYGAMTLAVPSDAEGLRTAVLWDAGMKRMYGFAQLSLRP